MFKKILVCLDGSELAEQILPYAAAQAVQFNARMVLIQVVPEPVVVPPNVPGSAAVPVWTPGMEESIKKAEQDAAAYLAAKAEKLRGEFGLEIDCVTMPGSAADVIVNYAIHYDIDLIMIASHGRSGLKRAVLGSVADHILRESGLPILMIKPKEK